MRHLTGVALLCFLAGCGDGDIGTAPTSYDRPAAGAAVQGGGAPSKKALALTVVTHTYNDAEVFEEPSYTTFGITATCPSGSTAVGGGARFMEDGGGIYIHGRVVEFALNGANGYTIRFQLGQANVKVDGIVEAYCLTLQ